MLAIYNVIERGRQTSFALRKAVGNDAPWLSRALQDIVTAEPRVPEHTAPAGPEMSM